MKCIWNEYMRKRPATQCDKCFGTFLSNDPYNIRTGYFSDFSNKQSHTFILVFFSFPQVHHFPRGIWPFKLRFPIQVLPKRTYCTRSAWEEALWLQDHLIGHNQDQEGYLSRWISACWNQMECGSLPEQIRNFHNARPSAVDTNRRVDLILLHK